jgi:hypothetical protein
VGVRSTPGNIGGAGSVVRKPWLEGDAGLASTVCALVCALEVARVVRSLTLVCERCELAHASRVTGRDLVESVEGEGEREAGRGKSRCRMRW